LVGGGGGTIEHWNGSVWAPVDGGTTSYLNAAWGSGPNDVWAVGDQGAIQHWNGSAWSKSSIGSRGPFLGVWGSGPSDIWMVGGSIQHWNGSTLAPADGGTTRLLRGVWGSGPQDVWSVGEAGTILHWNGSTWGPSPNDRPDVSFAGVWGTGPNDVWAFGCAPVPGGTPTATACEPAVLHWDGSAWAPSPGYVNPLYGLWGAGPNDVWGAALSDSGPVHWNGSSWTRGGASGEIPVPLCIWGSAADDIWAAGHSRLWHWNGSIWTASYPALDTDIFDASSIWGSNPTDIWTVGNFGRIAHWNGSAWSHSSSSTMSPLYAVWGSGPKDVWAVGASGTVLRWRGPPTSDPGNPDAADGGADRPVEDGGGGRSDARDGGACNSRVDASGVRTEIFAFANPGQIVQIDNATPRLTDVSDLALADVTGDAVPDLILAANYGNSPPFVGKVQLNGGRGDGTFGAPQVVWTGASVLRVLVIDVDGDSRSDLVVFENPNLGTINPAVLHVLRGDGLGHFIERDPSVNLTSRGDHLLAGDLTGDGRPELLWADNRNIIVRVNVNGTFPTELKLPYTGAVPSISSSLALGHVDGDNNLDVVFTRVDDPNFGGIGGIGILYGRGDGSFVVGPELRGGFFPMEAVTADFDGDGLADIQVALNGTQSNPHASLTRYVLDTSAGLKATTSTPLAASWIFAAIGDVDADCMLDFVYLYPDTINVFRGRGDGTFDAEVDVPSGHKALLHPALADLDGDGRLDVVYTAYDGSVTVTVVAALNQSTY